MRTHFLGTVIEMFHCIYVHIIIYLHMTVRVYVCMCVRVYILFVVHVRTYVHAAPAVATVT